MSRVPSRVQAGSEAAQPHRDVVPEQAESRAGTSPRVVLPVVLGLFVAGLCAASAYLFSSNQENVYGARAEILYQASEAERTLGTPRIMATQKIVLESRTVLQPAAADIGVQLDELQDATSVKIEGESDVMQMTVADPDPMLALALAKEIAGEYARTVTELDVERVGERQARARIITPAHVLEDPLEPKPIRAAVAGLLVGLVLAVGLVALAGRRRRRSFA